MTGSVLAVITLFVSWLLFGVQFGLWGVALGWLPSFALAVLVAIAIVLILRPLGNWI